MKGLGAILKRFWRGFRPQKSKRKKTSILKTSILRKLLEQKRVARNCSKLLEAARSCSTSSPFEQFGAASFCRKVLEQLPQNTSLQNASLFPFGYPRRYFGVVLNSSCACWSCLLLASQNHHEGQGALEARIVRVVTNTLQRCEFSKIH